MDASQLSVHRNSYFVIPSDICTPRNVKASADEDGGSKVRMEKPKPSTVAACFLTTFAWIARQSWSPSLTLHDLKFDVDVRVVA